MESEQQPILPKANVMGWQDFNEQMPNEGEEVVIANRKNGKKVIMKWYKVYEPILDKNYDRWLLLPALL